MHATCLAYVVNAHHPVHHALEAQAVEEVASLLLGSLSKVR